MTRLPVVSGREAVTAFAKIGYREDRQTESHIVLRQLIRAALDERRRVVHLYREETAWPMLQPEHRYADGPSDPLADAIRTLTAADLDFYVLKKGEELTATLDGDA